MTKQGCLRHERKLNGFWALLVICLLSCGVSASGLMQVPQYLNRMMPGNLFLSINLQESDGLLVSPVLADLSSNYKTPPWFKNALFNTIYYDPQRDYPAPFDESGNRRDNASFEHAFIHVYANRKATTDLSRYFVARWHDEVSAPLSGVPAHYYRFNDANATCEQFKQVALQNDRPDVLDTAIDYATLCFKKVTISARSGEPRYRVTLGREGRDERINFANWYQFYSTEEVRIKTQLSLLLHANRLGSYALRTVFRSPPALPAITPDQLQQPGFAADELLSGLFDFAVDPSLRDSIVNDSIYIHETLEQKLSQGGSASYFASEDALTVRRDFACRQNVALLVNAGESSYRESSTDLRRDLPDVAFPEPGWQRLSTHVIGLGQERGRDFTQGLDAVIAGAKTASLLLPEKYLLTGSTFSRISDRCYLTGINGATGEGFLVAVNDSRTAANCLTDDAQQLCSGLWNAIDRNQNLSPQQRSVYSYNPTRALGERGSLLRWDGDLSPYQRQLLLDKGNASEAKQILDYLRGVSDLEQRSGGSFKNRKQVTLGAVNKGNLLVVENGLQRASQPDAWQRQLFYPDDLEGSEAPSHRAYVCGNPQLNEQGEILACDSGTALRAPVIYVGAADGMLHAFDASNSGSGRELFAYVPEALTPKLDQLANPLYGVQSMLDGPLSAADVYYQNQWHTLLLGALGAGGQAYYALDISDPSVFDAEHADSVVRWEFTDRDDPDLGFSVGKAVIVKSNYQGESGTGRWVAVFGNGMNSTMADGNVGSGQAVLYVVDIETGKLIRKLSTGFGNRHDPNGLFTPALVFDDSDMRADLVYAGDAKGNLWKFDISATDPDLWHVAFSNKPFFRAKDSQGLQQVISAQPLIVPHPAGRDGRLLLVGTGRYLYPQDHGKFKATQSFYALWDRDQNPIESRHDLLRQRFQQTSRGRELSGESMDWADYQGWVIDFSNKRERIVSSATVLADSVFFATLLPGETACEGSARSWLMSASANSGGASARQHFDVNNDGTIDVLDLQDGDIVSGVELPTAVTAVHVKPCASGNCIVTDAPAIAPITIQSPIRNGRRRWRRLM